MTCETHSETLARVLAEDEPMTDSLKRHLEDCRDCQRVLEWHQGLERCGLEDDQVSEAELDRVRSAVLRRIPQRRSPSWKRRLDFRLVWLPAAACLCVGLLLGYFMGVRSGGVDRLIRDLRSDWAQGNVDLPYALKNVTLRQTGDGRVAFGFDVSTSVESVSSLDDPLIKELVVESLRQPGKELCRECRP